MEQIKKMGLKEFIEDNQSLLSSLAVFAGITALLSNLEIKWLSYIFSFISILGMLVIWKEINDKLPKKIESGKLLIFRYVLIWGMGCLVLYWLLEFRFIWRIFLFVPLTILFAYEMLYTLKQLLKITIVRKFLGLKEKKTLFQKITLFLTSLLILGISMLFAAVLSVPLNLLFDIIKLNIK